MIEHYAVLGELVVLTTNRADLNILPLRADLSKEEMIKVAAFSSTSAISYMDSFNENTLVWLDLWELIHTYNRVINFFYWMKN